MGKTEKDDLQLSQESGEEGSVKISARDWEQRKFALEVWKLILGTLIGFLSVLVAATIGYFNLSKQVTDVQTKVNQVSDRIESVEKNVVADRLIIILPRDGDTVDATAIVRGKSPYPERTHYIVVTSQKTNEDWVQKTPIKPDATGSWAGNAEFGSGDVGIGEKFLVRVLATSSTIEPGPLRTVPTDAIPSESIIVTRRK